tara:strand:+ start:428 stop:988 length:561 start_codon:yes stop_codon:yes gene_type:complete
MLLYRNLLKCFVAVFIFSCSDLTPLYLQDESAQKKISNIDILPISGRYGVYLKNELVETFGTNLNKEDSQKYLLKAEITTSTGEVESFNSDGTASRSGAYISIQYTVYDEKSCGIFSKEISTESTYNSKSGGYNFGNIASERAALKRNIEFNVKQIYPQIYNAIKNKPEKAIPSAPFYSVEEHRWC